MRSAEAKWLLLRELALWRRSRPYEALRTLVGEEQCSEVQGRSGRTYQLEILALWENKPGEAILVIASIDEGGVCPLTYSLRVPRSSLSSPVEQVGS